MIGLRIGSQVSTTEPSGTLPTELNSQRRHAARERGLSRWEWPDDRIVGHHSVPQAVGTLPQFVKCRARMPSRVPCDDSGRLMSIIVPSDSSAAVVVSKVTERGEPP